MAGVSPAAPYRHFKDRDSLMTAVAEQGFTAFADKLELERGGQVGSQQMGDTQASDPMKRLKDIGEAYLDFARTRTRTLCCHVRSWHAQGSSPVLARESDRAFNVLRDAAS